MGKECIFICEGYTELFFCEKLLKEHFINFEVAIKYHLISHSNGGIVKWVHLKRQIEDTLAIETDSFVTTFIDYYGIDQHHGFPGWADALSETNKASRMAILENAMQQDITPGLRERFVPYIQLHEFEAYIFSDYAAFEDYYSPREANFNALRAVCDANPNPEDINNSIATAPSKRLEDNIPKYNKTLDGVEICKQITLPVIRGKCPRFNQWLQELESL